MAAKYYLFRNLHKPGMASIVHKNKTIDYVEEAMMFNCEFVVSEKSRIKVTKTFRKNVHAKVASERYTAGKYETDSFEELYYNPYFTQSFLVLSTGEAAKTAEKVIFKGNKVYAKNVNQNILF